MHTVISTYIEHKLHLRVKKLLAAASQVAALQTSFERGTRAETAVAELQSQFKFPYTHARAPCALRMRTIHNALRAGNSPVSHPRDVNRRVPTWFPRCPETPF